ncbi:hypothetical protein ANTRET_LOCUS11060 [Anthophora retusa]
MEATLKQAIACRGQLKASLTRFKAYLDSFNQSSSITELQKRLEKITPIYEKFDTIQCQIESSVDGTPSAEEHAGVRDFFENSFFELTALAEDIISRSQLQRAQSTQMPTPVSSISGTENRVKLPTIELPTFDGTYNNWIKDRYEDLKTLKYHHVRSIYETPSISKESLTGLRHLIDSVNNNLLALKALGEPTDSWDTLIIYLLTSKLDNSTQREWERKMSNTQGDVSLRDMINFLENQCKYLERIASEKIVSNKFTNEIRQNKFKVITTHVSNSRTVCSLCKGDHQLHSCSSFLRLSPIERRAKIQDLHHLHSQWNTFREELMYINEIKIPRHAITVDNQRIELHAFSDASEKAYGACVYLRTLSNQGRWSTHLLCAKSKVAPLKVVSLPRLELCGAQLLAQLVKKIRTSIDIACEEYYWCDSTIVLAWISSPSKQWKTFVANRVAEIQRLSQGKWSHVASSENPADIISRGISPSSLVNNHLWWNGPYWLQEGISKPCLDIHNQLSTESVSQEFRISCLATSVINTDIFNQFSCYSRLTRVIAYCLRFINNVRIKIQIHKGTSAATKVSSDQWLTSKDLIESEEIIIKTIQYVQFSDEIKRLQAAEGLIKRPLTKICVLPMDQEPEAPPDEE